MSWQQVYFVAWCALVCVDVGMVCALNGTPRKYVGWAAWFSATMAAPVAFWAAQWLWRAQ